MMKPAMPQTTSSNDEHINDDMAKNSTDNDSAQAIKNAPISDDHSLSQNTISEDTDTQKSNNNKQSPEKKLQKIQRLKLNQSQTIISALQRAELKDLCQATALQAEQLTRQVDLASLPRNSKKIKNQHDGTRFLGQARAKQAIETAIHLPFSGYHVVAVGASGLGKRTMIQRLLQQHAKTLPTPSDWVYVNDFDDARHPLALRLTAGQAVKFQKAVHDAWLSIFKQIQSKFNAESYHRRIDMLREQTNRQQQDALLALTQESAKLNLKFVSQEDENYFVPLDSNDPNQQLSQQQVNQLDSEVRIKIASDIRRMEKKLSQLGTKFSSMEEQVQEKIVHYNKELAKKIIQPKLNTISQRFEHIDGLEHYLQRYCEDVIEHIDLILSGEDDDFRPSMFSRIPARYQVNVVASHKLNAGAPVIFEDFPTHYHLLGHVEQMTRMGSILTDFSLIRAGALHQANGGFLILQAEQLLEHPYAWQGLKRALKSRQLKLSSLEQLLTLTGSVSIEPQSIALNVKVILLAEESTYHELVEYDPEFLSLFKIRADFNYAIKRTPEHEQDYLQLVADFVETEKLLPIDNTGLASILNDASRQAQSQHYLSLHASNLGDLLRESQYYAEQQQHKNITAEHIQQAIRQREYRLDHLRELYWDDYVMKTQLIETQGAVIGQVNALTVIDYAGAEFGLPSRLTASVSHGDGEVLDIERSVELGGSLHAKGILIMSSYLKAYFGHSQRLHFSASIAHEQSYNGIDGDSATMAEVCALISAISQLPVDQSWSITGSMNQFGQAQPIGGINAKIESFYDLCQLQGLTGQQGVIIPKANMQHLMLRDDVVQAVAEQKFHIHAVEHIEDALALILATPVGELDDKLRYSKGSIFARVMKQLDIWQAIHDGEDDEEAPKVKKKKKKKSGKKDKGDKDEHLHGET
ncbi:MULTISPECIES: Lon protease family protein [unclassified Acinetobacter]|uniref:Lon protease family protein n=1 Tax=unclassified Acinetobacter TaxID=196816 RepID=UPI0035BB4CA2